MQFLEKVFDNVQYALNINAATFSGAIDIIVVEQPDGSLRTTPFHVRSVARARARRNRRRGASHAPRTDLLPRIEQLQLAETVVAAAASRRASAAARRTDVAEARARARATDRT